MEKEEFRALEGRFKQGLEKLELIRARLADLAGRLGVGIDTEPLRGREGEVVFWFAGARYYARVRIADRSLDDGGPPVTVPIGWIDWGQFDLSGAHGAADQSTSFDDRGVLFVVDKEEVYCDVGRSDDPVVGRALSSLLSRLVARAMAANSSRRP